MQKTKRMRCKDETRVRKNETQFLNNHQILRMFIATNIAAANPVYHFRNAFVSAETVFRFFMQRFVFYANLQSGTIKALLRSLNN